MFVPFLLPASHRTIYPVEDSDGAIVFQKVNMPAAMTR
jgi:hypothetical protein